MIRKMKILYSILISNLLFLPLISSTPIPISMSDTKFLDYDYFKITNNQTDTKIVYISRHGSTISNFNYIAKQLNLNVTILEPNYGYGKKPSCYDVDKCKSYVDLICSKYEYIIFSDIIPDSYIFFTNECKAKVVLEITNRYDIFISNDDRQDYKEKLAKAISNNKNLIVVENNPYEVFYACQTNINIPNYYLIRPVGYPQAFLLEKEYKEVHDEIAILIQGCGYYDNVFLPTIKKSGIKFKELNSLNMVDHWLLLPIKLLLYYHIKYGVVMLFPSEKLLEEICRTNDYHLMGKDLINIKDGISNYMEFYNKEFRDLVVYFDKLEDIPEIIKKINYEEIRSKCKKYMENYEKKALNLWSQVLGLHPQNDMIKDNKPLCDQKEFLN
eukprot:jgi/Orpsp1_1/1180306/evm.model.c7180000072858.1